MNKLIRILAGLIVIGLVPIALFYGVITLATLDPCWILSTNFWGVLLRFLMGFWMIIAICSCLSAELD